MRNIARYSLSALVAVVVVLAGCSKAGESGARKTASSLGARLFQGRRGGLPLTSVPAHQSPHFRSLYSRSESREPLFRGAMPLWNRGRRMSRDIRARSTKRPVTPSHYRGIRLPEAPEIHMSRDIRIRGSSRARDSVCYFASRLP